jgi:hypothetical protein
MMIRMRITKIKSPPINQTKMGMLGEGGVGGAGEVLVTKELDAPCTERPPATGFRAAAR